MNKIIFSLLSCMVLLWSCSEDDNRDKQWCIVNAALLNSNKSLENVNEQVYNQLQNKLRDPQTRMRAEVWQPKAMLIKAAAAEVKKYTDSLKRVLTEDAKQHPSEKHIVKGLFDDHGAATKLFAKLLEAKTAMFAAFDTAQFSDNPVLARHLWATRNRMLGISPILYGIDSIHPFSTSFEAWKDSSFSKSSPIVAIAMLNKIDNDIFYTENEIIEYFNSNVMVTSFSYEIFSSIASLSSSIVKNGQAIRVTAGVGAFSAACKPTISINGRQVSLVDDAIAIDTIIAKGTPGKHYIPVRIEFTKPDGSSAIKEERLHYLIQE